MATRPPGPKGLPLVGNSRKYAKDPFAFLSAVGDAYPRIAQFDLGPLSTYMVTDPADIERVLVSEADQYHKLVFGDAVDDLLGDGLLLSDGKQWRDQRNLANPAFTASRVQSIADTMARIAEEHIAGWSDGDELAMDIELAKLTVKVIVAAMFGVEADDETVETVQNNLEPLGRRFEPDPRRVLVPEWAPTKENREFADAVETLEGVIDDLLAQREGTIESGPTAVSEDETNRTGASGEEGEEPMDLASILLRARDQGEQSEKQLRDELMTMLLAGHDTTALALSYTLYLLSEQPEARERHLAEVDEIIGTDQPSAAHVRKLEYTDRVLSESMRLYPPVYAIFREPQVDVKLGGYRVPAESAVMVPQWVVHRSERYWDEPDQFDPSRWEPEPRADRPRFAYFPFGGGPRHCIGKQFANLEAKLVLAALGKRFSMEYVGPELELRGSLTMHPKEPLTMRVSEREN
ncbi:Unspecific monooxygenase [halophilic archaeon DL31]|jgi:cytochrome P450|nr:Unspecific monooxygenase [halophilic archaeon DL31]